MGPLHGQRFYSVRADAGGDVTCPFGPRPFSAMIELRKDVGEDCLQRLAQKLLDHGCRSALCRGEDADRCRRVFDDVIDQRGSFPDAGGRSPWSMTMDDTFEDALNYFTLPTGDAETGLLVVIGEDNDFCQAVRGFGRLIGRASEWLSGVEPETEPVSAPEVYA